MTFQKTEMQSELQNFMHHFAGSIERVYGQHKGGGLLGFPNKRVHEVSATEAMIESTMLWKAVNDMYDFGIRGILIPGRDLGREKIPDADYIDAEMFLRGLTSLDQYLAEDETTIPRLALQAVRTAIARHVLEGGERYTGFSEEDAAGPGLISIAEMALLADMDERSVRNAANPKLPNPLVTVVQGKRTYVASDVAKRWLAERKGFVPTKTGSASLQFAPSEAISDQLSANTLDKLKTKASAAGVSIDVLISQLLAQ